MGLLKRKKKEKDAMEEYKKELMKKYEILVKKARIPAELSGPMELVHEIVTKRLAILLYGPAGSGKTTLLKAMIYPLLYGYKGRPVLAGRGGSLYPAYPVIGVHAYRVQEWELPGVSIKSPKICYDEIHNVIPDLLYIVDRNDRPGVELVLEYIRMRQTPDDPALRNVYNFVMEAIIKPIERRYQCVEGGDIRPPFLFAYQDTPDIVAFLAAAHLSGTFTPLRLVVLDDIGSTRNVDLGRLVNLARLMLPGIYSVQSLPFNLTRDFANVFNVCFMPKTHPIYNDSQEEVRCYIHGGQPEIIRFNLRMIMNFLKNYIEKKWYSDNEFLQKLTSGDWESL